MKNKMPLDGLGLGHDSGSVHCDMLKMLCFRTAWGGGLRPNHKSACTYFKPYHFKNDELVWGSPINNLTPYGDYWLFRSYPVKDGHPVSFLVY